MGKPAPPSPDLNVCPGTPSSLRFSWFSKIFHPCRAYNKEFQFNNDCKKNDPFKVDSRSKLFIDSNSVSLHFFELSLKGIPPNWGKNLTLGFEIVNKNSKKNFKTKSFAEIPVTITNGTIDSDQNSLDEPRIYGPGLEGGQDKAGNLIENQFDGIEKTGQFRFYFLVYSEGRNDFLRIPGPILKNFPKKLKQRNTCR
jgi:hypothetical protein